MQGVQPLVADQRLRQLGVALHDVDQVIDHPALGSHDEVEVAQAHIEVDDDHFFAGLRQRRPQCGGGGGFAHASLARCHDQDLGHRGHLISAENLIERGDFELVAF